MPRGAQSRPVGRDPKARTGGSRKFSGSQRPESRRVLVRERNRQIVKPRIMADHNTLTSRGIEAAAGGASAFLATARYSSSSIDVRGAARTRREPDRASRASAARSSRGQDRLRRAWPGDFCRAPRRVCGRAGSTAARDRRHPLSCSISRGEADAASSFGSRPFSISLRHRCTIPARPAICGRSGSSPAIRAAMT